MTGTTSVRRAALVAAVLAALAVSCGTTPKPDRPAGGPGAAASTTAPGGEPTEGGSLDGGATGTPEDTSTPATPGPPAVRDAFAGLQATLKSSCTPGDCAYFLGRVHDELQHLDQAMKADGKGPGHFPEPIARIAELNETLAGDSSFENLKKHQKQLIGTRDFINTWMQGHPDDYR